MNEQSHRSTSRRSILRAAGASALAAPLAGSLLTACSTKSTPSAKPNTTVTVTSYGGSYNDQLTKTLLKPFEKKTGVRPSLLANTSLAGLKAQVQSGDVQWDIVELTAPEYLQAVDEGLLEKLDYGVISDKGLPSYAKADYGIKYLSFLFVMAWDQKHIPDAQAPKNWEQFLDPGRYKGKRSVYAQLSDSSILEAARLAAGVAFDKIYPLDVDAALKYLAQQPGRDKLIYHTANQEPIQQLTSGEVALSTSFNNRISAARKDGARLNFTARNSVVAGDYFVVPKGARNKEAAFRLLDFMSNDAAAGADFVQTTNLTLANTPALAKLPASVADSLPTSPKLADSILVRDDAWWAKNLKATEQRFKLWQAGS
ncbi:MULTISPECIES: extracellular solute-binding protein [Streptomyces]|uniref:extracellular solute-binding protein n=1 Tax=Streptomyces TaxID=1883 RepID=UPI00160536C3|nr:MULTISPECIES: extracellular solute-binding protein [Streptomyces]MCX4430681.1 extracellular solute-binding protein [Streptomyces mirabilis]